MATFVLIHGSSANAGYWRYVGPRLTEAGHEVIAPDLPTDDDSAGFTDYADAVVKAIGDKSDIVIVGQSMGAYTAPIVAERVATRLIVLLAPMIPAPGEAPGQWWQATGQPAAQEKYAEQVGIDPGFDVMTTFMHDVPQDVVDELMAEGEPHQSGAIFGSTFPLDAWPDVPTKVIACANDRLFPLELIRRLADERLGLDVDEIDSGHLSAFGHPDQVAAKLTEYVAELR